MRLTLAMVWLTACAGQRGVPIPPQRPEAIEAIQLYMKGANTRQVAAELAIDHATARELLHDAIVELNRKFYRDR